MANLLKNGNNKLYFSLAAVGALLMWNGGQMINGKLLALPVKEIPRVPTKQVQLDTKSFYPVWIKQAAAINAEAANAGELDDLFHPKEEVKPVVEKPKAPDYPAIVRDSVHIDAIADNGAILNGKFYLVGAQLDELTVAGPTGAPILPVLIAVSREDVLIRVIKTIVSVKIQRGY